MSYQAPLRDMRFVLHELFDVAGHCVRLGNGLDRELIDGVLEEAAAFTGNEIAPLNRNSDEEGCQLVDGKVSTPKGFRAAYQQYVDNGWASMTGPVDFGGQGFPQLVAFAFHEMLMGASLSFRVYSGLTEGAVLALDKHGSAELKHAYLGKLVSGQWTGTMCLTEPQAGTDLALLRTRAEPQADGSYRVSGSKIFISGGEQDLSENIVHLVLARLPDAPAGVKGISLLLVPKFVANADGTPGAANAVSCGAIEHKMGIKGASTCVMNFDGATGWLVGEANQGLACMFTMMNDARFQVGLQGLGLGEAAFQGALRYARERLQSRGLAGAPGVVGRRAGGGAARQGGRPDHRSPGRAAHAADPEDPGRRLPHARRLHRAPARPGTRSGRAGRAQGGGQARRAADPDRQGVLHRHGPGIRQPRRAGVRRPRLHPRVGHGATDARQPHHATL